MYGPIISSGPQLGDIRNIIVLQMPLRPVVTESQSVLFTVSQKVSSTFRLEYDQYLITGRPCSLYRLGVSAETGLVGNLEYHLDIIVCCRQHVIVFCTSCNHGTECDCCQYPFHNNLRL